MNQTASDPYTLKCKRKVDGEAHAVLKDVDVAGLLAQPLDCKFDQQNVASCTIATKRNSTANTILSTLNGILLTIFC